VYRYVRPAGSILRISVAGVLATVVLGVLTPDAGAKVLPYQLDVSPTTSSVGERIVITVETDPANDLGVSFDFEIAVYPASMLDEPGFPPLKAKRARRVVMTRTSDAHRYEGVFTPTRRGRYVVVGRSGYAAPVPITVTGRRK
jgi:hypothetical protein